MKKKDIVVFLERSALAICSPGLLAPCQITLVRYGSRRIALRVAFRARDCYFIPGGCVAVDTGTKQPVLFGDEVLEVVVDGESTKNRWICPHCGHLSLKIDSATEEEGQRPQFHARCTKRGCRRGAVIG